MLEDIAKTPRNSQADEICMNFAFCEILGDFSTRKFAGVTPQGLFLEYILCMDSCMDYAKDCARLVVWMVCLCGSVR